jgi:hypothetical protein
VRAKPALCATGTPGQPVALQVASVVELLLEVYQGADRASGVRASTRIDLAGGATEGELELPGLTVGNYFVRLAALGSGAAMLAETGCTFPLVPGATAELAALVSPDGVRLSGPGGGCGPYPSLVVVDALTVAPGTMSAGGSVVVDASVRNVGDTAALQVAPVLGFSRGAVDAGADFDAVELVSSSPDATARPGSPTRIAGGGSAVFTFDVVVAPTAALGAISTNVRITASDELSGVSAGVSDSFFGSVTITLRC